MKFLRHGRSASTYAVLAVLIAASAGYAMETAEANHTSSSKAAVISEDQKPAFLATMKRQNMQPSQSINRVSVGDRVPDFGITYYMLPLSYGRPFYRCAAVGGQIVIIDRFSGLVVQVLD
jgi:hypothetical protein